MLVTLLPLKPEVSELLEEHPVALAAHLIAGEDPVEVVAEAVLKALEVLLSLRLELELPLNLLYVLCAGQCSLWSSME